MLRFRQILFCQFRKKLILQHLSFRRQFHFRWIQDIWAWSRSQISLNVGLSLLLSHKGRSTSLVFMLSIKLNSIVVSRTRIIIILFVQYDWLPLEFLFLLGKIRSFLGLNGFEKLFTIKVLTRTWWMWVMPPLSLLLCYKRTIAFFAVASTGLNWTLSWIFISLKLCSNKLRFCLCIIESLLASPKTFFLLVMIDYRFIIRRNASYRKFGVCVLDTAFVKPTIWCTKPLVAKVETWRVKYWRL